MSNFTYISHDFARPAFEAPTSHSSESRNHPPTNSISYVSWSTQSSHQTMDTNIGGFEDPSSSDSPPMNEQINASRSYSPPYTQDYPSQASRSYPSKNYESRAPRSNRPRPSHQTMHPSIGGFDNASSRDARPIYEHVTVYTPSPAYSSMRSPDSGVSDYAAGEVYASGASRPSPSSNYKLYAPRNNRPGPSHRIMGPSIGDFDNRDACSSAPPMNEIYVPSPPCFYTSPNSGVPSQASSLRPSPSTDYYGSYVLRSSRPSHQIMSNAEGFNDASSSAPPMYENFYLHSQASRSSPSSSTYYGLGSYYNAPFINHPSHRINDASSSGLSRNMDYPAPLHLSQAHLGYDAGPTDDAARHYRYSASYSTPDGMQVMDAGLSGDTVSHYHPSDATYHVPQEYYASTRNSTCPDHTQPGQHCPSTEQRASEGLCSHQPEAVNSCYPNASSLVQSTQGSFSNPLTMVQEPHYPMDIAYSSSLSDVSVQRQNLVIDDSNLPEQSEGSSSTTVPGVERYPQTTPLLHYPMGHIAYQVTSSNVSVQRRNLPEQSEGEESSSTTGPGLHPQCFINGDSKKCAYLCAKKDTIIDADMIIHLKRFHYSHLFIDEQQFK